MVLLFDFNAHPVAIDADLNGYVRIEAWLWYSWYRSEAEQIAGGKPLH